MTECLYGEPLISFETGIRPEKMYKVPLLEKGIDALKDINAEDGAGS